MLTLIEAIELHLPRGYMIDGPLGTGATSTVYVASRAETGERLVVKVMRQGTVTPESADRFMAEIQLLKQLDHPRIIPVLEPGEANGALFFTMPFVAGQTLRARLAAQGSLAVRDALGVARDVAEALGYAHGRGIVHRDVKPENILLGADGAYLMDFGFARPPSTVSRRSSRTPTGLVVGTAGYMSPEQIAGHATLDSRSDFYSLGCVLYEMLSGDPPAEGFRSAAARTAADVPDVQQRRGEVPDDVAAIVRRLLDPHPTGRYDAAGVLVASLTSAMERAAAA